LKTKDLENEIAERRENREEIKESIDGYCKFCYGIDKFSSIVDKLFARQESFGVCLARQIPTVNIEHLAKHLFAGWLSEQGLPTKPIALGLLADSFSTKNDLKRSYGKVPYYLAKDRWVIRKKERGLLDGKTFANIQTTDGTTLPVYHQNLRKKVFRNDSLEIDVSDFFLGCLQKCLDSSRGKPESLFVKDGDKEKLVVVNRINGQKILRPLASWYYPLYLLFFVNGSRALLSTVDDNEKVSSWFEEANHKIEEITGFSPLLIHTPKEVIVGKYKSNLLEVIELIFQDAQWRDRIEMPSDSSTLFKAYESFERQILKLGE